MRIYIGGPMRGRPLFNFPAFDAAAERLRAQGHEVCNPADRDRAVHGEGVNDSATGNLADIDHTGFSLREALAWDTAWIAQNADAIYMLDGWERSKGATAELALALALGLDVFYETEPVAAAPTSGEVRVVSETGGEKGSKPERFDLIPVLPLTQLARLYGEGAKKYEDRNFERGYPWSLSYAALQRHLNLWWSGEDFDAETGAPHVINAAWHCFALALFMHTHPEFDNRPKEAL